MGTVWLQPIPHIWGRRGSTKNESTFIWREKEQRDLTAYWEECPCREGNALSTAFKINSWLQEKPVKIKNLYLKADFSAKVHTRSHYNSSTEIMPRKRQTLQSRFSSSVWHATWYSSLFVHNTLRSPTRHHFIKTGFSFWMPQQWLGCQNNQL